MKLRKGMMDVANAQPDVNLKVLLNIGEEKAESKLPIRGMEFVLQNHKAEYEHVKLPGADGPHPNLSTGHRTLNMVKEGEFIDVVGTKIVRTLKGCWEMIWKEGATAGSLLCGFEIPEEYKRNDASLPKGRIYFHFPIWTKETLEFARAKKEEIETLCKQKLKAKNEALEKYVNTKNLFMKALHYRDACQAVAEYTDLPRYKIEIVPDENEVIPLQDDLFLTTKGTVWSKNLPNGKQILLGTADAFPVPAFEGLAP